MLKCDNDIERQKAQRNNYTMRLSKYTTYALRMYCFSEVQTIDAVHKPYCIRINTVLLL